MQLNTDWESLLEKAGELLQNDDFDETALTAVFLELEKKVPLAIEKSMNEDDPSIPLTLILKGLSDVQTIALKERAKIVKELSEISALKNAVKSYNDNKKG